MALPIVGSACGSPGEGIAGPPAPMIAFPGSHSSRSASRSFASAALRISTDFRYWLLCRPCAWRMPLACALRPPPDSGMRMMRGDMAGIRARLSRRRNHIALQIDAPQPRNQSGTFSGTFLGVGSRYIPFDPLAFRGGDHSGNVTKMLKAFVYWAFLGERIGDPSRSRA